MGYVGCVSGACLSSLGHQVIGVEPNRTKVDLINSGKSPIVEKELPELIEKGVREGRYRATDDWRAAIAESDIGMVCVGTPSRSNGSIDLSYVRRVCEQIGQALKGRKDFFTVVIRSTIVPGSVEDILVPILERESGMKAGEGFGVCMNPEFLRESTSVRDFHDPPKTVIGELNAKSGEALAALYAGLPGPQIRTSIRVAEMVKYVDNAFHALKVTFANEVGGLSKELKIDSHRVMEIFCQDTKLNLSPYYLKPGFAFGGSCLPKDLRALNHEAHSFDLELPLLRSILESNKLQVQKVIRKLRDYKGRKLGFLGLSFKGGTDDLRESPIVEVIEAMIGKGCAVQIYDRHVSLARLMGANKEYIEKEIPHISRVMCGSIEELMANSEIIIVSNRSPEFTQAVAAAGPHQVVVDLVRIVEQPPANVGEYVGLCW
ncbi:MAG: nucleotide sugar dehydrogenase [Verrucomicrobia bacterium]|nr:nucleotide sugar dehydrogenase [Verrucomicrobiota bacterium]